jgi:hypothetical protein
MPAGGMLTTGIVSGLGSIFGGLFGGGAAKKAAQQQIEAEQKAQGVIQGSEKQALGYQQNATDTSLGNLQPYLQAGTQATSNLNQLTGTPGQGLLTPWTQQFTAPTAEQAAQTPGYQFQLQQGEQALQNSAAARGGLLSGQTLGDLNNYAQGVASTNYQNVFNNAQSQYQSAYNTFQNNQNNTYNRLMGLSNTGQNAANTMGSLAQMGAQNAGNITSSAGGDIASLYNAQGAARAGGTIGTANAYGSIIPGITNSLQNMMLMKNLIPSSSSSGGYGSTQSLQDSMANTTYQ